jgi:hypothetical protein
MVHRGGYQTWVGWEIAPHDPVAADFIRSVLVERELRPSVDSLFQHEYIQREFSQSLKFGAALPSGVERSFSPWVTALVQTDPDYRR